MKKIILFSFILSSISLHSMGKLEQTKNNEKIDTEELREILKEAANKAARKQIKYNAKALVLQERVRRLPGYEAFDILKLIDASNETNPTETAQERVFQLLLFNPNYQEANYDSDMQELIKNIAPISQRNLQLEAVIKEMKNIFDYAETISKLKKLEAALDSRWKCSII